MECDYSALNREGYLRTQWRGNYSALNGNSISRHSMFRKLLSGQWRGDYFTLNQAGINSMEWDLLHSRWGMFKSPHSLNWQILLTHWSGQYSALNGEGITLISKASGFQLIVNSSVLIGKWIAAHSMFWEYLRAHWRRDYSAPIIWVGITPDPLERELLRTHWWRNDAALAGEGITPQSFGRKFLHT